jgi:hypothetical protein
VSPIVIIHEQRNAPKKIEWRSRFWPWITPIVIETEKEKKRGGLAILLIAIGVGILALAGIALLIYVNSFGGNIFGGVSGSSSTAATDSGDSVAKPTTALIDSFKAIDGKGNVIEENGVTKSDEITITGYSDSEYDARLQCSIDSLHIYCNGSGEVSISGLPTGKHTFTVVEPSNGETIVRAFSWNIIPS